MDLDETIKGKEGAGLKGMSQPELSTRVSGT